jgi:uncharacterized protein (DUF433 family)
MAAQAGTIDLIRYVEHRRFGPRPHLRGRRIPVAVVASAARDNPDIGIAGLMIAYDLSEIEVLAALLYYEQHKSEIDAQEAAVDAEYQHHTA